LVIPSINCPDFEAASIHIKKAEEFSEWIHIDVSDGKFSDTTSWGDPEELQSLETSLNVEVHLMVDNPDDVVEAWLAAGAKRVIVHIQTTHDPEELLALAKQYNAEIMLALDPTQSVDEIILYVDDFKFFQILTVYPGLSGQEEQPGWADKIKSLREISPTVTIEVDGGINPNNARIAKDAGADILISGHYIFSSPNPKGAYEELNSI